MARAATIADIPALIALIESAYRGDTSREGWTTEANLLGGQRVDADMLHAQITDPAQTLRLFDDEAGVVACVAIEHRENYAYIGLVSVRPTAQGDGWGRRLLSEAETVSSDKFGADRARMSVIRQRPELIAWYERRGYKNTGQTLAFPYGDPRFGEPQRDDLEFVILEKSLVSAGAAMARSEEG
jgi:ribosomal protein S18 acetylase RimI-like enzyme